VFLANREAKYFLRKGLPAAANHPELVRRQVCDFPMRQHLLAYWSQRLRRAGEIGAMRFLFAGCCAWARCAQKYDPPPIIPMNSRRRICSSGQGLPKGKASPCQFFAFTASFASRLNSKANG